MTMKNCSKCNLEFDESFFTSSRNICKDCRNLIRKVQYAAKADELKKSNDEKTCSICEEKKKVSLFRIGVTYCTECHNEKRRSYVELKKAPLPKYSEIKCPDGYKLCKDCYVVKKEDEFREKRLKCKKCENIERVAYKKGEIKKQPQSDIGKDEDDFSKKLKASCRMRIRETLSDENSQKLTEKNRFGYIYDLLDCDMNFLKKWLRFNYTPEMTDDNYGTTWVMDHVIPIYTFKIKDNYEQNKKLCYSWYNISSLTSIKNGQKFSHVNKTQLEKHREQLLVFCTENEIKLDKNYLLLCAKHLDAGNPLEPSTTTSQ